jgi:phosphatidate cytidylyltransferase
MPEGGPASHGPARPWLSTELGARLVSALVLAAVALAVTWQGGPLFALFWLGAGIAVAVEWVRMARIEPVAPVLIAMVAALACLGFVVASGLWHSLGIGLAACLAAVAVLAARSSHGRAWALAGLASSAVIALVPTLVRQDPSLGIVGILWMFAVVWMTDIAAFFTGRFFGGPKLWPSVSPKKTWSGFAGGLAAGVAAGVAVAALAERAGWVSVAPLWAIAAVSAVASVVGQIGDLAESAMKRRFGVKDSGHVIPGHGGVMDRLDAFWSVALFTGVLLALRQVR